MADVKDILGVPRSAGGPAEKQDKAKEPKLVKPKGMSREAFALLSSTHPLVPSQLMGELKKPEEKPKKRRGQVTYEWRAFVNPSRSDGLQLEHWVKCYKDAATGAITPADKEYAFAKYNRRATLLRYNAEEWGSMVAPDPSWSRQETDYLLDLLEQLDMRWLVVTDRWDFLGGVPRSVEDLKARYYSVARQLLEGREGGKEAVANQIIVKHPFSAQHERERKRGLELLMARSPHEDAAEDGILAEATKIEAKRKAEAAAKRGAAGGAGGAGASALPAPPPVQITEYENEPPVGTPPLFDATGQPALPVLPADAEPGAVPPRVLARVAHTKDLVDSMVAKVEPEKHQKALQGSMTELKMADVPRGASRAVCGAYVALLHEVVEHLELKRRLATRQAMAGTKRARREEAGASPGDGGAEDQRVEKRQRVARRTYDE